MMPAYNFKKQFRNIILDGSKMQTIRRRRKRPTKPGDKLYLYTGMRTVHCELLKEAICTEVIPIKIGRLWVSINGKLLNDYETLKLATDDGFNDRLEFFCFFNDYLDLPVDDFEIIKWQAMSDDSGM